jgi:hypothetical protein
MHKIEISGVVHQNLSSIFNLCNAEGNTRSNIPRNTSRYPKFRLTLTLGRLGKEREERERRVPWSIGRRRRGWPADGETPAAGEEANVGGGGGSKGGESSGEE